MISRFALGANLFFAEPVEHVVEGVELFDGKCNLRIIRSVRDSADAYHYLAYKTYFLTQPSQQIQT